MTRAERTSIVEDSPDLSRIAVLPVTPLTGANLELTQAFFKAAIGAGAKAILLIGYATGTTPGAINPLVKDTVESGIPIFVLSNNKGDDKGPQRITYGSQQDAVDAGITPLRDVNINHIEEVMATIDGMIADDVAGAELAQAVVDVYGTSGRDLPSPS